MARYLIGLGAGILLIAGGIVWWRAPADAGRGLPPAPPAVSAADTDGEAPPAPPEASERTREERRFARYDRDKDGLVGRDEYLAARRRAFAKLDLNGDGRLSFDEYAVKGIERFAKADADRSGGLVPAEFLATRIARQPRGATRCPPPGAAADGTGEG
jgi:hypothetical protein